MPSLSGKRMELALEVDSVELVARRISEYLEMRMPEGLPGKSKCSHAPNAYLVSTPFHTKADGANYPRGPC